MFLMRKYTAGVTGNGYNSVLGGKKDDIGLRKPML